MTHLTQTRYDIMGMPITVTIAGATATPEAIESIFSYFETIDARFSPFKTTSEISRLNRDELSLKHISRDMETILILAEQTKIATNGYFDIGPIGACDPCGLVKGWAIEQAAKQLRSHGYRNFYLDVGGDIAAYGTNALGDPWRVGIRNPFASQEIIKILHLQDAAVATSGTYERGHHITNPKSRRPATHWVSFSVVGPSIYDADRYATAAFAMGQAGLAFIEAIPDYDTYAIDHTKQAYMTTKFKNHTQTTTKAGATV